MTLKDINWNQVYYFYEVARKLSMKEAAQTTGVSLPTVSEQIKRLETSLNVTLFKRFPRRLELTSEGETLYQYAKEMFDSGLRFLDAISNTPSGYAARIGLQETAAQPIELDFVRKFMTAFSEFGSIHTFRESNSERLFDRLLKGEFDWAITLEPTQSFRVDQHLVGKCEIVFCAARDLPIDFQSDIDLLRLLPLARSSSDYRVNEIVEDHLSQEGIVPLEILEIDHKELCMSMVEQGKCVTTITKNEMGQNPKLRYFTLASPIEIPCYAIWRKANERMTAVKVLLSLLGRSPAPQRPKVQPTPPPPPVNGQPPDVDLV